MREQALTLHVRLAPAFSKRGFGYVLGRWTAGRGVVLGTPDALRRWWEPRVGSICVESSCGKHLCADVAVEM